MTSWYWLDLVIIGVIALSVLTGLVRGFVKELIALGVWVIAVWLSFIYAKAVAEWLGTYVQDKSVRVVLAYITIILGTLLAGGIINSVLSFVMHRSGLSGTDRILGASFGLIRGIFLVSLVMVMIRLSGFPEDEYAKQSLLYGKFTPIVNWMYQYTPDLIHRVEHFEHQSGKQERAELEVRDFQSL